MKCQTATKKTHKAAGCFFSAVSINRVFCLAAEEEKKTENPRFSWLQCLDRKNEQMPCH
jgi:hypothetical protein